jgi:hypothetical protein
MQCHKKSYCEHCFKMIWSINYCSCDLRCKGVDTRRRNGSFGMRSSTDFWKCLLVQFYKSTFIWRQYKEDVRFFSIQMYFHATAFSYYLRKKIVVKSRPDFTERKSSGSIAMRPHHTAGSDWRPLGSSELHRTGPCTLTPNWPSNHHLRLISPTSF